MIRPERRWSSAKVIGALADVMVTKGIPEHIRSDNGPEFVARGLRTWLADTGAKTLYIEPGSPWENGYCESFNSKLRDEFLNGEIFYSMKEIKVLAERWRVHYNTIRPHSSLGYKPPAPAAWLTSTNTGHTKVKANNAPTFAHPQPAISISIDNCATLTIQPAQMIGKGQQSLRRSLGRRGSLVTAHNSVLAAALRLELREITSMRARFPYRQSAYLFPDGYGSLAHAISSLESVIEVSHPSVSCQRRRCMIERLSRGACTKLAAMAMSTSPSISCPRSLAEHRANRLPMFRGTTSAVKV